MANVKSVLPLYQKLTEEWNKRSPNLDECGKLLANLKVKLTQGNLTFMPTQDSVASQQELIVARDILEIGAQWAIAKKDVDMFERYMAQLKCYYLDYSTELQESAYKYQLLGLNLLRLLAQNKLGDFHTVCFFHSVIDEQSRNGKRSHLPQKSVWSVYGESSVVERIYQKGKFGVWSEGVMDGDKLEEMNLVCKMMQEVGSRGDAKYIEKNDQWEMELELLPTKEIQQNIYIKHPVSIEQYLMEGSYNKVFLARGNVPAASYKFFMDVLLNTIRDEIARCLEKAYEKIGFSEARRMLFFDTDQLMLNYAREVRNSYSRKKCLQQLDPHEHCDCDAEKMMQAYAEKRKWNLDPESPDGMFYFHREQKADESIPSLDLATRAIEYAHELEMII